MTTIPDVHCPRAGCEAKPHEPCHYTTRSGIRLESHFTHKERMRASSPPTAGLATGTLARTTDPEQMIAPLCLHCGSSHRHPVPRSRVWECADCTRPWHRTRPIA